MGEHRMNGNAIAAALDRALPVVPKAKGPTCNSCPAFELNEANLGPDGGECRIEQAKIYSVPVLKEPSNRLAVPGQPQMVMTLQTLYPALNGNDGWCVKHPKRAAAMAHQLGEEMKLIGQGAAVQD